MHHAPLGFLVLIRAAYFVVALDSVDRHQPAEKDDGEAPKNVSTHSTRVMRRSEEWRPMQVTVFSVDAKAHLQQDAAAHPHRLASERIEAEVQQHSDPLHRAQGGHPSTDAGHHRQAAPAASQRHHQPPHEEHRSPDQQSKRKPSLQGDRPEPSHASQPPRDLPHASTAHKPQPKASPTSVEAHHEPRRSEHTGKPSASSPPATTHSRGHAPQPDRTQSSPATPAAVAPSKTDAKHWRQPPRRQETHEEARQELHAFAPPIVMSQSEDHGHKKASTTPQGPGGVEKAVAGRKTVTLDGVGVAQSKAFAEQLIAQERQTLCPGLPSRVSLELLAANAKIAEEITFVFRAKLSTEDRNIPNQAVQILRTGIEVEWKENSAGTTNDEQSALARAEDELLEKSSLWDPISRGAKLILPLSACDLMNETFSLMCNRGKKIHADGKSASLSELGSSGGEEAQVEASLRQLRELYLSLPGALGVVVDKELEAYELGLKRQELYAARDPRRRPSLLQAGAASRSFPPTFSWLYERPQCLDYIHHQGTCGACYMFAALDSLSDRHCIDATNASRLGKVDHLSVQMALLCEPLGRQCAGGWADVGFNYSVREGLQTSTKWPYERSCLSDSECQFGKQCFSPSSYGCPSFFSQEELDEIATFSDALRVTKHKCETSHLEDPDNCKVWAETMFAMSPTMVFMPESCFCIELVADWRTFSVKPSAPCHSHGDGSGMASNLIQGDQHRRDEDEEEKGFNFFDWLASLFFGSSQEKSQASTTTFKQDIPGGSWSSGSKSAAASSLTLTTTTVEQCSRDRCLAEPQPHKATRYHYIVNQKDAFKTEIYNDGPFYTSYYIYEDFTWFFQFWPEESYNYQWGAMQGGHAVVLIGWESSCQYHGDKIAIPGANDPIPRNSGSSRRRTNKAECWHLRNTWGDEWGDKGYFRVVDDMLTGPPGYHLHIASAAADGPKSVETVI